MIRDLAPSDPFFALIPDPHWNACVGSQGEEYHYIDGYIEAALDLAESVVSKKLWAQRDTLILPILFNARHSLELLLKYVCTRTLELGLLKAPVPLDHNILRYLSILRALNVGDYEFRCLLNSMAPFVESLSQLDDDGQAFRYFKNLDGARTIQNTSVINIRLVLNSLRQLKEIIDALQHCVRRIERERQFGYHTDHCSRKDLLDIAEMLPDREAWDSVEFIDTKQKIRALYGLSNNGFSKALNVIQSHRLMKLRVGISSQLFCISDENLISFLKIWRTLHPLENTGIGITIPDDMLSDGYFEKMLEYENATLSAISAATKFMTAKEVWDTEEIFQIGRNGEFPEFYDYRIEEVGQHIDESFNSTRSIRYMLEKTNLMQSILKGVAELGRPDLAKQIISI